MKMQEIDKLNIYTIYLFINCEILINIFLNK